MCSSLLEKSYNIEVVYLVTDKQTGSKVESHLSIFKMCGFWIVVRKRTAVNILE